MFTGMEAVGCSEPYVAVLPDFRMLQNQLRVLTNPTKTLGQLTLHKH